MRFLGRFERPRPGALDRLRAAGVQPRTILDVGAALGDWTRACRRVFPEARYVAVEPLAEFHARLRTIADEVVEAAAAAETGEATLNVHRDLVGSSLLGEREPGVDGEPRTVRAVALDDLEVEGPVLLKVDAQGAELEILRGAERVLGDCAAVQLEVSFFSFFVRGAAFDEVVAFMREHGLVVYDVIGLSHRPLDGALAQADVVFVPEESPARREHVYATPEQRRAQDERFAASIRKRLR